MKKSVTEKQCTSTLRKVAKEHGISLSEVREKISFAIVQAMQSDDPQAKEFWKANFPDRQPTPEEFMMFILKQIEKEG